jgi:predicted nucleotide-binding protein (sugar kinase/HSP70/actin superfamily)
MKRRGPLKYLFYPCLTHVPSWLGHTMDNASCPIVAGSPNVVKAAFTKELDFFARAGVEYLDPALTFTEPYLLKKVMAETWMPRLGITEDESDFAVGEAFAALELFDKRIQDRGREILDRVERENKIAILLVGRPYHHDPGLHHGIPDELQVRGYPILTIRSLPRDPAYMKRFFGDDDPMDIRDVWPENYSANSAQKVWAVRYASRHPHLALLDLSSFKCGHDAPTYGIIDKVVSTAKVPYSALHDLDQNKPGGSILIRVLTFVHKLKLVEEELEDRARARLDLAQRVATKRRELEARILAARKEDALV